MLTNIITTDGLTPNIMELLKLQSVSLKKLGSQTDLAQSILSKDLLEKTVNYLLTLIKRKDLEVIFRKYVTIIILS
jgi:hypothetical protein